MPSLSQVLFIGGDPRVFGSVQIRCLDIANRLGCDYTLSVKHISSIPERYSVFICIKPGFNARQIAELARRGRIIWDIIDDSPPEEGVYMYLASTQIAKKKFGTLGPIEIIPHHHCNLDGIPNSPDCRRPGWIGQPHWCPEMAGFEYSRASTRGMTSMEVAALYRSIGIGLNLRSKNRLEYGSHVLINAGIKLINCIGFGIPSISSEEPAYMEIGADCTIFSEASDVADWVARLQSDHDLYLNMRRRCIALAPEFHIDKIVAKYRRLLHIF